MFYLMTNLKQPLVKILAIALSVITFWGAFASSLTLLSRLGFTNEAITYTCDGIEYKEKYPSSHYQVGDKFSIFLKYNNPRQFYDASDDMSTVIIFCYVIAAIWFGICGILDISYFVFHKKLIT